MRTAAVAELTVVGRGPLPGAVHPFSCSIAVRLLSLQPAAWAAVETSSNSAARELFPATGVSSTCGAPWTRQGLTAFSSDLPAGIVRSGKPLCQAMKTSGGQKSWKRLEKPALPPQHWMRMARKSIPTFRSTCPVRHGAQPRPTVCITNADAATSLVLPGCCIPCYVRQADIDMRLQAARVHHDYGVCTLPRRYLNSQHPSLKHQKDWRDTKQDSMDMHYHRGRKIFQANKFRKGACEKC